jgi:hypothetical protein
MLRNETGKRNREVEAERYISIAIIFKAIDLLLNFGAGFTKEAFRIFKVRGFNGHETETPEYFRKGVNHPTLRNGIAGKYVAEPL